MENNTRLVNQYQRNWVPMERELELHFSNQFRRIWIQSSRLGTLCVTLFPSNQHQGYRFVIERNFGEITIETIKNLIMRNP